MEMLLGHLQRRRPKPKFRSQNKFWHCQWIESLDPTLIFGRPKCILSLKLSPKLSLNPIPIGVGPCAFGGKRKERRESQRKATRERVSWTWGKEVGNYGRKAMRERMHGGRLHVGEKLGPAKSDTQLALQRSWNGRPQFVHFKMDGPSLSKFILFKNKI